MAEMFVLMLGMICPVTHTYVLWDIPDLAGAQEGIIPEALGLACHMPITSIGCLRFS